MHIMPSPKITEQPLVTIGMCVFNCDRFLVKALDSLLSQEYKNFELIISDNASEDRTQEICLEYQARDPRIQYSRNETNMGAIFNGVKVINLARGKYFMFGSDHDLWHEAHPAYPGLGGGEPADMGPGPVDLGGHVP